MRTNWLTIHQMLERRVQTPQTSSVGRLFDAVASLAGVTDRVSYEGQAAVQLEWLASGEPRDTIYPFALNTEWDENAQSRFVIDTRPLIAAIVDEVERGTSAARIARRFHSTLVEIITQICCRLRDLTGLAAVVLSGGVFLNALLTAEVSSRLSAHEFRVYRHCLVPPNDGGLSLGQLAIAAARLAG